MTKKAEGQDFFQEIAMTRHPLAAEMGEIPPRPLPTARFSPLAGEYPVGPPAPDYTARRAAFGKDLAALRQKYLPFLSVYSAPLPQTVEAQEFSRFSFRYLAPHETMRSLNDPTAPWEELSLPDYRGPADEHGRWRGYYRTHFSAAPPADGKRAVLCFQCVDYKALIYLNGCFVGEHEGFFAPFSFDVTDYLSEENELVIECQNDYTILGTGPVLDGDKIYAATGPGWDDPATGWHHCPAGAGVFGRVTLEYRPDYALTDVFVRPEIEQDFAELRVGLTNYTDAVAEGYRLHCALVPRNFHGMALGTADESIYYIGPGKNEYRFSLSLAGKRLWEPETPWLYTIQLSLYQGDDLISTLERSCGLKKFVCDEAATPKGRFYLNNHPLVLRGANEMGHLQQCVMQGDREQLIDDILIAKLCHINYYRITQRPVQEEIYEMMDALGMMQQCDFPLFGFLRRPQFAEAVRQCVEMEHLIRPHVSTVLTSLINEPMCIRRTADPDDKFSRRYRAKGHRHLQRDELEAFFVAARKAIYTENPDRVVKNAEGDYDPPTGEGLPDFHCYTMWYTNHAEPIGRLAKGWLPPLKPGWMVGCGEYGAEGLDNADLMQQRYPAAWLATDTQGRWYPDKIVRAQTSSVQGDWYPEQTSMATWVAASQRHQRLATTLMTDALRRRADVINHTAIHLLIDAWPAGWMKTLLGCDRQPKPAYFAFQDSLTPYRLNLFMPRHCLYGGGTATVESWLLNDTASPHTGRVLLAVQPKNGSPGTPYALNGRVEAATSTCMGLAEIPLPAVEAVTDFELLGCLLDETNTVLYRETLRFTVYPAVAGGAVQCLGSHAEAVARQLGLTSASAGAANALLASDFSAEATAEMEKALAAGRRVVALYGGEATTQPPLTLGGLTLTPRRTHDTFFVATAPSCQDTPLTFLYNETEACWDFTAGYSWQGSRPADALLAWQYGPGGNGPKERLPVVAEYPYPGGGVLAVCSLYTKNRIGVNADLDTLLLRLLGALPFPPQPPKIEDVPQE